jgi:formylglycine-generating enzyme required for sulfatase activity
MINIIFSNFFLIFAIFFSNCIFAKNMMFIPNGTYVPLFKDNATTGIRHINEFLIDKYPVTNIEFFTFLLNNPQWDISNVKDIFSDTEYLFNLVEIDNFNSFIDYPVVNVSWFAADAFCNFYSNRLPTLDEWEYVAKSSDFNSNLLLNYKFEYVNIYNMPCNYLNVCGLHGFIWEWVLDFNSVILINSDSEGGNLEEVLYCGATSLTAIDPTDYISFIRFAFRNTLEANYTMNKLGFRCVRNVY